MAGITQDTAAPDRDAVAGIAAAAESYYRAVYYGSRTSWKLRDLHMFYTLETLLDFRGGNARAVVWAHNSHLGDASATEMGARGEHRPSRPGSYELLFEI